MNKIIKSFQVCTIVVAASGCAELEYVPETSAALSEIVVSEDGKEFIVIIESESVTVTDDLMQNLVSNINVVQDFAGIELIDGETYVNVRPPDNHWDPTSGRIQVTVEPLDSIGLQIDSYRWEWIDLAEVTEFCPPGH